MLKITVFCVYILTYYCSFRVREKDKGQSYALSMCYHGTTKHYKIDKRKTATGEVFAIEEGPTFENLMDVSYNIGHLFL